MSTQTDIIEREKRRTIRNRWLLSAPALLIILLAATGPLLIVLIYSFLTPGPLRQCRLGLLSRGLVRGGVRAGHLR